MNQNMPRTQLGASTPLAKWLILLLLAGCTVSPPASESVPKSRPVTAPEMSSQVATPITPTEANTVTAGPAIPPVIPNEENNIYFRAGATKVDAAGELKLRDHANRLLSNRKIVVTLTGLTDNSGSRSVNLLIAEQRVEAVAKILRSLGVPRGQIRAYARGTRSATLRCNSETCRSKMRRVELSYEE